MPSTAPTLPDELAAIDLAVGWPAQDVPRAVATELAESSGNPSIVGWDNNGTTVADTTGSTIPSVPYESYDTGLFQDNSTHDPNAAADVADPGWLAEMENPVANSAEALSIFNAGNGSWGPWDSDVENSGTNPAAAAQLLAQGQQGLADATANNNAQLDSITSWIKSNWPNIEKGFKLPIQAGADPAGAASTVAGVATQSLTSGWQSIALKIGIGVGGGALILLGLYRAAAPAKSDDDHPIASKAAEAVAA